MKFKIDVEMTPEEMRQLMGLPDMQEFHADLLGRVSEQMASGADGYDPLSLLQLYKGGSPEMFQRLMSQLYSLYTSQSNSGSKD